MPAANRVSLMPLSPLGGSLEAWLMGGDYQPIVMPTGAKSELWDDAPSPIRHVRPNTASFYHNRPQYL